MSVVPRSLQSLIQDAQKAKADREVTDIFEDGQTDSVDDCIDEFIDELSRGKYSKELYLSCVADDCEEAADWAGAKVACRQIIDLGDSSHFDRCKAHSRLGDLHALLGEDASAIEHYRAATTEAKSSDSEVLCRSSLSQEAWQLIGSARFRQARGLARNGLAIETDADDGLGTARLLLVLAVCNLAEGRTRKSHKSLQEAWQHLEELRVVLEEYEVMQDAAGVYSTYHTWWRVQAEYLRAIGDSGGELQALNHSLEKARCVANQSQVAGPRTDAKMMRTLLAIADALRRANRSEEAVTHLDEANEIMNRRGLPDAAISPYLVPARPTLKRPRFSWWW